MGLGIETITNSVGKDSWKEVALVLEDLIQKYGNEVLIELDKCNIKN